MGDYAGTFFAFIFFSMPVFWLAGIMKDLGIRFNQATDSQIFYTVGERTPNLPDAREKACYAVASELLANKGLSDETYAAAEKVLGLESLVALVATTGSFSMTCMTAGTFKIDPPAVNPTPLAE